MIRVIMVAKNHDNTSLKDIGWFVFELQSKSCIISIANK
jgi:hypothetical protein